ncbi:MAG TPA: hypothetical protein EYH15_02785, partial [Methanothermococcus okinawensis]|uniref:Enolase N-terminal domain-containing protein n=1 Tax=Methanothermococcus okinawensis TaxID=155863 RepID=A0A832ZJX4_9EURY|nr:hypothetical protein [Methanothermococcus okinawensis]HIP90852.1 hypothetical protein [Methanothermococcus okinawensis]
MLIERITAKKVFKNSKIGIKITTLTPVGIGYHILPVENPDYVISDIENIIAPELIGHPVSDQDLVDSIICSTPIEDTITTMGVSLSVSQAAANALEIPLFKYIGGALSTQLPSVACPLLSDGERDLIVIPITESIEEMIYIYRKILERLSHSYRDRVVDIEGRYRCRDVFQELDRFKEIISDISEEEDVKILVGASVKEDIGHEKISNLDYLESPKTVEFDGFLTTEDIDEMADFSKVEPYTVSTLSELYYYTEYILERGLNPLIVGDNPTFSHIAVGLRIPLIRCSINSNILNELWDIERILNNPYINKLL